MHNVLGAPLSQIEAHRIFSRSVMLILWTLTLLLNVFAFVTTFYRLDGDLGFSTVPTKRPFISRVVDVGGPGVKAGVRVGDLIDARKDGFYWWGNGPAPGKPVVVPVTRNGRDYRLTDIPDRASLDSSYWWSVPLRYAGIFCLMIFSLLLLVRSADAAGARILSLLLIAIAAVSAENRVFFPSPLLALGQVVVGMLIFYIPNALFIIFSLGFGAPVSRGRRNVALLAYAAFVFETVLYGMSAIGQFTPWYDPSVSLLAWSPSLAVAVFALTLLCGLLAVAAAAPGERQRIAWVVASLGLFWTFAGLPPLLTTPLGQRVPVGLVNWIVAVENAALIFVPIVLAYALLSRRLFNLGFVLNRAAVFTVLSTAVVGSFTLLEWVLGKWFDSVGRAANLAINVALALAIGFSIKFLHDRVDRFVDIALFRKRHESETALRRFAHEAAYITDQQTLLERTVSEVCERVEVTEAALFLHDGNRYKSATASRNGVVAVSENDPAIVALTAWQKSVSLHDYTTVIKGEYAFPLVFRGALTGALVCGPKRTLEAFAPDEIDAIEVMAHGVGMALSALKSTTDDPITNLRETLLAMQDRIIDEVRALSRH